MYGCLATLIRKKIKVTILMLALNELIVTDYKVLTDIHQNCYWV